MERSESRTGKNVKRRFTYASETLLSTIIIIIITKGIVKNFLK